MVGSLRHLEECKGTVHVEVYVVVLTSQYLKVVDVSMAPGSQCLRAHEVWQQVYITMP